MKKISKKQAKEIARDLIQEQVGVIYYLISEDMRFEKYTKEERDLIEFYLDKDCERMLKLINKEYITF